MAKYTVELSNMVAAHAHIQRARENEKSFDIKSDYFNLAAYKFASGDFVMPSPVNLIQKYSSSFFMKHFGSDLKENITTDQQINDQLFDQFAQGFISHFYTYEISQENPEGWCLLVRSFLLENLPIWYQGIEKLLVEKAQWITNISDSTGLTKSVNDTTQNDHNASIAGNADTPQNELDFKMNTGDPTDDYNFHYASDVSGSKSTGNTTANNTGSVNSTNHTQGRNATIAQLMNELLLYANGVYFDLFDKALDNHLFMRVL